MSTQNDLEQHSPTGIDWILEELDAAEGTIPEEAIYAAREHRDVVVPMLIQAIQQAASEARDGHPPEGNAHFFALFLLTEFEAKESLPAILDAMRLPGGLPDKLFGDGIGSILPRTLAALAADTPDVIHELIADCTLASSVRWSAVDSFPYLIRDGKLERDEVVEHLRNHLRNAIENEDGDSVLSMVWSLDDLGPAEAMEEIEQAFHLDLVDQFMIDMPSIEQSLQEGEDCLRETLDCCPPTGIPDTIEELSTWSSFVDDEDEGPEEDDWDELDTEWKSPLGEDVIDGGIIHFGSMPEPGWNDGMRSENMPEQVGTIRNTEKRVGRNEPCPCGSGKKYKKCCGGS